MADRSFFLALTAFALLLGYLYLVLTVLEPFLGALIWAAVLGLATFPLYRRLRNRLGGRNTLAAAVMTPAVVLLLAVPIAAVILYVAVEINSLYEALQLRMGEGTFPSFERIRRWPVVALLSEFLRPITENFHIDLRETLTPALQNLVSALVEQSQKAAKSLFSLLLDAVVMVLSLFFLYRDGERILPVFSSLIPLPDERKDLLAETTRNILSAILYGVFLTAVVQGNLALIGYWIVGLPSPALLALITALASLVPLFGTALVWVPAALYLLFAGHFIQGIILLAWGTLIVATADNFIRPYLICGKGHVHFLTVLLGILGGLAAFGPIGLILGPVILALFLAIAEIYRPLIPPSQAPSLIPPE